MQKKHGIQPWESPPNNGGRFSPLFFKVTAGYKRVPLWQTDVEVFDRACQATADEDYDSKLAIWVDGVPWRMGDSGYLEQQ